MKNLLYFFVFVGNCTWGFLQTLNGLISFIRYINKPRYWYKGSIVTTNATPNRHKNNADYDFCYNSGAFIFISKNIKKEDFCHSNVLKHEYGHCLQNLLLGPFTLLVITIPNRIWWKHFRQWRTKRNISYLWFYTESWANKWGKVDKKDYNVIC